MFGVLITDFVSFLGDDFLADVDFAAAFLLPLASSFFERLAGGALAPVGFAVAGLFLPTYFVEGSFDSFFSLLLEGFFPSALFSVDFSFLGAFGFLAGLFFSANAAAAASSSAFF